MLRNFGRRRSLAKRPPQKCKPLALILFALFAVSVAHADAADPRLEKRITFTLKDAMLKDVCERLTQETGVKVVAGNSERDWKGRERRVTVRFKDLPLKTALEQIADGLYFHLSRTGQAPDYEYRLWQDLKSREFERAVRLQQEADRDRKIAEQRQRAFDDAKKAVSLSHDEARKLKDKDPWMAFLGGTEPGRAFATFLNELPTTSRELLLRGRRVSLPPSELPRAAQNAVDSLLKANLDRMFDPRWETQNPSPRVTRIKARSFRPGSRSNDESAFGLAGLLEFRGIGKADDPSQVAQGYLFAVPILDGSSPFARLVAELFFDVETAEDKAAAAQLKIQQMEKAIADVLLPKDEEAKEPDDPALKREIEPTKFASEQASFTTAIIEFVEQAELQLVLETSDNVTLNPFGLPLAQMMPKAKSPLWRHLAALKAGGFEWRFTDGVVKLQHKDWAMQRADDVSASELQKLADLINKQGSLSLEDLGRLVLQMSDGQILNRVLRDERLQDYRLAVVDYADGERVRPELRLYGSLTPSQQSAAKSDVGVPFAVFTSAQWDWLLESIGDDQLEDELQTGKFSVDGLREMGRDGPQPAFVLTVVRADKPEPTVIRRQVFLPDRDFLENRRKAREQNAPPATPK